jgi:polar amino acid transport system substrate-binding protein
MADYPYTSVTSFKYQDKGFVANPPFSAEPIGIAIRPDDPLLMNFLENFLFLVKGDGMLDAASKRWFADPSWISELP